MKFDVYADLQNLFMLNFSVPADRLQEIIPNQLKVLERKGRGFPSVVLPGIKNLRHIRLPWPRVHYDLFGLRVLVTYPSKKLGMIKGIYFKQLIMDPTVPVFRIIANRVTKFQFEAGRVVKRDTGGGHFELEVEDKKKSNLLKASVKQFSEFPNQLTPNSSFETPQDALAMYNDISYGFLPDPVKKQMHILQIADIHPNYNAWPLRHLDVEKIYIAPFHGNKGFWLNDLTMEPCYYIHPLPRYWRWLDSESF